VIRNPEAKEKKGLIDMNCRTFQEALNDVFSRSWEQDQDTGQADEEQTQPQLVEQGPRS
jgi:Ras-related GTP-binding protein C/D